MVNSFLLQKFLKEILHSFPMHRKITNNCNYAHVPDWGDDVPLEKKIERWYIKTVCIRALLMYICT